MSENKKSFEALADEDLAGVTGGGVDWGYVGEQMSKYGPDIVPVLLSLYM